MIDLSEHENVRHVQYLVLAHSTVLTIIIHVLYRLVHRMVPKIFAAHTTTVVKSFSIFTHYNMEEKLKCSLKKCLLGTRKLPVRPLKQYSTGNDDKRHE